VRKDLLQVVAGSAIAPRARQKREQRS
jgi:hypothetical protein